MLSALAQYHFCFKCATSCVFIQLNAVCFRDILKVTKVSQLKFVLTEDLTQIGLSRPEQRRYKKIYSKYFPNPYISKIRKMLKSNKKRDQVSDWKLL